MLRERDNVERQLGEQKMALDQQKKRYEEMQVRGMRESWATGGRGAV